MLRPQLIAGLEDAVQLSVGNEHACALRDDGKVLCWGKNNQGQLGRGSVDSNKNTAAELVVDLDGVSTVSASLSLHTCAVRDPGEVWCWGYNVQGELGDGSTATSSVPVRAGSFSNASAVATSATHSCALLSIGEVWCWGSQGPYTKLGRFAGAPAPGAVANLHDAEEISAGEDFTCARSGGQVRCWGDNREGQLGDSNAWYPPWDPQLVPVAALSSVSQIDAGYAHTCALLASAEVACWGMNFAGQLGQPTTLPNSASPRYIANIQQAKQVASGGGHSCALTQSGELLCWGNNDSGQLGDGGTTTRHTVAAVSW